MHSLRAIADDRQCESRELRVTGCASVTAAATSKQATTQPATHYIQLSDSETALGFKLSIKSNLNSKRHTTRFIRRCLAGSSPSRGSLLVDEFGCARPMALGPPGIVTGSLSLAPAGAATANLRYLRLVPTQVELDSERSLLCNFNDGTEDPTAETPGTRPPFRAAGSRHLKAATSARTRAKALSGRRSRDSC